MCSLCSFHLDARNSYGYSLRGLRGLQLSRSCRWEAHSSHKAFLSTNLSFTSWSFCIILLLHFCFWYGRRAITGASHASRACAFGWQELEASTGKRSNRSNRSKRSKRSKRQANFPGIHRCSDSLGASAHAHYAHAQTISHVCGTSES